MTHFLSDLVSINLNKNGHAKCKHHHILDTIRTFLVKPRFLNPFLGEVALIVVHTIRYIPSPTTYNKSPSELFMNIPNLSSSPGCVASLVMALLKSVITTINPETNIFLSLVMWNFGNIELSQVSCIYIYFLLNSSLLYIYTRTLYRLIIFRKCKDFIQKLIHPLFLLVFFFWLLNCLVQDNNGK